MKLWILTISALAESSIFDAPVQPVWLSVVRELGSFGLVAFVVWYVTTHVMPESRRDYLKALAEQRVDYLQARAEDRREIAALTEGLKTLAEVTREHVVQAQSVWEERRENGGK